jgi:signal peptidase I
MKKTKKEMPYIVLLVLVVICSLLCSLFCFQLTLIQGDSMEPNYHSAQLRLLNKLDKDYRHGDCILFYCEDLKCSLIKRIVALPGDRVQIKEGTLLINGAACTPYPNSPKIEHAGLAENELTVPEGCCFVLGDNFTYSRDSRHAEVGFVKFEDIRGKIK